MVTNVTSNLQALQKDPIMPLIIVSGYPSSGKSTRTKELITALNVKIGEKVKSIKLISDDTLLIDPSSYSDRESEKAIRSKQISAVKKHLAPDNLVILDSLCYIKGFRYQLYCEAKAVGTTSCVLLVAAPAEICRSRNEITHNWPEELLEALIARFEEPNSANRWDSPLFVVTPEDDLPVDEIWNTGVCGKTLTPNQATKLKPAVSASYLTTLSDQTNNVVKEVLQMHKIAPGAKVVLENRTVQLPYRITPAQLNRIRQTFVQLNKAVVIPPEAVKSFFIDFLEKNWDIN